VIKLWIDDLRPAPEGWFWARSVNDAKHHIEWWEKHSIPYGEKIEVISIDHDAGGFYHDGGDFIRVLDWLEETGRNYPIRIHSMNPVGVANMRAIIEKNGWKEVL
jgi:hypothetical protein